MAGTSSPRPSRTEPHEGYIGVGYIRGPHGLDGDLKVESLSSNPERFQPGAVLRADDGLVTVRSIRPHNGALLVRFEGIQTREQADELRGLLLEIPETALGPLEPNEYYRFQLVGLEVLDGNANKLGVLQEVLDTGANDVYIISDGESELLVPALESVVKDVDLSARTMVIDAPAGLERRALKKRA